MKRWFIESLLLGYATFALIALAAHPFSRFAVGVDDLASWQMVRILWGVGAPGLGLSTLIAYRNHQRALAAGRASAAPDADWPGVLLFQLIGIALIAVGLLLVVRGPFWDGLFLVTIGAGAVGVIARRILAMSKANRPRG